MPINTGGLEIAPYRFLTIDAERTISTINGDNEFAQSPLMDTIDIYGIVYLFKRSMN